MRQIRFAVRNVLDKLSKGFGDWRTFKFYIETYILGRFDRVEPDIYIVSYPKCGRTWLRVMLQRYLEMSGYLLKFYHDRTLVGVVDGPVIKFEHDQGTWIPAPCRISQLKFRENKYRGKKVIFLTRDPRDVLISAWYHLTYRERILQSSLSEFVRDPLVGIDKVIAFTNMWLEHSRVPKSFLLATYEDMHADSYTSFQQVLTFMGYDVDSDRLREAIKASSFKSMRRMEESGTLKEPWMKPGAKNLGASMKVRKGKIGGYRDELSEEDIGYLEAAIHENLDPNLPYHIA